MPRASGKRNLGGQGATIVHVRENKNPQLSHRHESYSSRHGGGPVAAAGYSLIYLLFGGALGGAVLISSSRSSRQVSAAPRRIFAVARRGKRRGLSA